MREVLSYQRENQQRERTLTSVCGLPQPRNAQCPGRRMQRQQDLGPQAQHVRQTSQ